MTNSKPLVSIGLPTYNRPASLKRAVESVLAQDYQNLELVISDNASTDETKDICEEYSRQDSRVSYITQPVNKGVAANFQAVVDESRGEFFMWLADDDWIDRDYVSRCLVYLGENPDCLLVGGREKYYRGAQFIYEEGELNLPENTGYARVLAYFRQVKRNGIFYGLMPRSTLEEVPPLDTLGGDWLYLSHVAFRGKMKTIADVSIHRSIAGLTQDPESVARHYSLSHFEKRHIFLGVALRVFKDIAWQSPVFGSLGRASRRFLACRSAIIIVYNWEWNDIRARLILRTRLRRLTRNLRARLGLRTRLRLLTRKWLQRG